MPNNHPYDKKGDRRQQNLNDLVDGAVNFGLDISSTVLSGIAGALDSVGDSLNRAAQRPEQNSFIAYRRKLDNSLAGHYGGWDDHGRAGLGVRRLLCHCCAGYGRPCRCGTQ